MNNENKISYLAPDGWPKSLWRLARAVWHLGLRLGHRYWLVESGYVNDPEGVLRLATACDLAAVEDEAAGEKLRAALLRDWACKCRRQYAQNGGKL